MKILAISDVESSALYDYFNPDLFKDIDLVLAAGDLKANYLSFIATMIHAPLLYVHGNHDARLLNDPPGGCTCIDGEVYIHKNIRIFGMGGCMTYTGGPLQFNEKEMSRKLLKKSWSLRKGMDIFLSHAPAFGLGDGKDIAHIGYKCFVDLLDKHQPRLMIHGHQHLNYGRMERIIWHKNTQIINAYGYTLIEFDCS